jgi:hypothetical protein
VKTGSWSYGLTARCRLEDAEALLADVTKQGRLHPLIIDVTELPAVPGALRSFAIKDRLKMAGVPFTITYVADLLSRTGTEIVTVARQQPRTTLRNVTRLTDNGDGTVTVDVEVTMTAPSLLHGYALKTGRKAHLELAERIKDVLENP